MLVIAGSCAFAFRPTESPTLERSVVKSLVTNGEPAITLLGKVELLFGDLFCHTVSRRALQLGEDNASAHKHGFPEPP